MDLFTNDEAFAKDVADRIKEKKQSGEQNLFEAVSKIAAEKGYEVSAGDAEEYFQTHDFELADEIMKTVSGGGNCGPGVGDGYTPPDKSMSGNVQKSGCG